MKIVPFGAAPRNKYGAKKVTVDGIVFDSKLEAARWGELRLLERAGKITGLERQVRVDLIGQHGPLYTRKGRRMKITVDFAYTMDGIRVFEDAKGMPTRDYEVRVAVARAMGLEVRES